MKSLGSHPAQGRKMDRLPGVKDASESRMPALKLTEGRQSAKGFRFKLQIWLWKCS